MSQSFDNKARKQLSAHQPDVDPAAIWGAIEPGVDALNAKRRKRRMFAWWFFSLAGISMAAVLVWWLSPAQLNTQPIDSVPQSTAPTAEQTPPSEKQEASLTWDNEYALLQESSESGLPDGSSESQNIQASSFNTTPTESTIDQLPPAPPSSSANPASEADAFVEQGLPAENEQASGAQIDSQNEAVSSSNVSEPIAALPPATTPETKASNVLTYLPGLRLFLLQPFPELPVLNEQYQQSTHVQAQSPPRTPAFQFSLGLHGGASAALRNLNADEQSAQELLEIRERTEQSLEVLHAGVRLGVRHRSGFGLYSGVQWTRIAERMEFKDELVQLDSVYGIMALAVNPYGDTTALYGEVPHTTTTSINKRYYNYYQLIDVPVFVGYQQHVGSWVLGAEAGVFLNLRLRSSGQVLQTDFSGFDLAEAQPELLPNRIGLSYHLGLRASRELLPGLELSVSPQWRFLPNISTDANPIRQRYNLFGLQLGLQYEFNR